MALVELVELWQQFQQSVILKNINIEIAHGEAFILIGPTGSGKTTLLRVMDLLDIPARGQIIFDGIDVTRSGKKRLEARRRMAYVQQKPIVFNTNVFENVACGLRWRGEKGKKVSKKVEEALQLVGMQEYIARDAKTLSGGETQRIAIARALVTGPEMLILDEPTANLDPVSTSKVENILDGIIKDKRIAIMMATHDMTQGQRLAQNIGVMMSGELVQIGDKNDIFDKPLNLKVAGFVGMQNMLGGSLIVNQEGLAQVNVNGKIVEAVTDYKPGEAVFVCVRPEDIVVSYDKPSGSMRNTFKGEIKSITSSGPIASVELDCGFRLVAFLTVRSVKDMELGTGKNIFASFKATSVHVVKG